MKKNYHDAKIVYKYATMAMDAIVDKELMSYIENTVGKEYSSLYEEKKKFVERCSRHNILVTINYECLEEALVFTIERFGEEITKDKDKFTEAFHHNYTIAKYIASHREER